MNKENKLQLLRRAPVRLDWVCTVPRVRHSLILWLRARMLKGGAGRCGACCYMYFTAILVWGHRDLHPAEGKEGSSGSGGQRILLNSMYVHKACEGLLMKVRRTL